MRVFGDCNLPIRPKPTGPIGFPAMVVFAAGLMFGYGVVQMLHKVGKCDMLGEL